LPVAAIKRGAANAAFYLIVNGFQPGVGFDDLIKRVAVRAPERFCPDHDLIYLDQSLVQQHGECRQLVGGAVQQTEHGNAATALPCD
jgi:hypothetical protein